MERAFAEVDCKCATVHAIIINVPGETKPRKRPKIREAPESAELREAFEKWAAEHGTIWFENDRRLAEAIATVLNIELVWGDKT